MQHSRPFCPYIVTPKDTSPSAHSPSDYSIHASDKSQPRITVQSCQFRGVYITSVLSSCNKYLLPSVAGIVNCGLKVSRHNRQAIWQSSASCWPSLTSLYLSIEHNYSFLWPTSFVQFLTHDLSPQIPLEKTCPLCSVLHDKLKQQFIPVALIKEQSLNFDNRV